MPSAKTILTYLSLHVFPPLAGAVATWLIVHVQVLGSLGISHGAVASAVLAAVVFGVTAGLSWLTQHHVLLGVAASAKPASKTVSYK